MVERTHSSKLPSGLVPWHLSVSVPCLHGQKSKDISLHDGMWDPKEDGTNLHGHRHLC